MAKRVSAQVRRVKDKDFVFTYKTGDKSLKREDVQCTFQDNILMFSATGSGQEYEHTSKVLPSLTIGSISVDNGYVNVKVKFNEPQNIASLD